MPKIKQGLLKNIPGISEVMIVGDEKPYCIALIWVDKTINYEKIARKLEDMNLKLSNPEKIKRWLILRNDLTIENGDLTANLKLKKEIKTFEGKVIFIKGVIETEQKIEQEGNVTYYNFMTSDEIETAYNESAMVLCRSGYTTIMDLAKLGKKAFFIPTPGQFEQEYLAKRLKRNGIAPYAKQDNFEMADLKDVKLYQGLTQIKKEIHWKQLFILFEGE